jgi:hypothetical protein
MIMSAPGNLMGLGLPAALANILGYGSNTVTGIGTAQAGAAPITTKLTLTTTAGGATAFILPQVTAGSGPYVVTNPSATTALVFGQGTETIDGGTASASVSIAQNKTRLFWKTGSSTWVSVLTA